MRGEGVRKQKWLATDGDHDAMPGLDNRDSGLRACKQSALRAYITREPDRIDCVHFRRHRRTPFVIVACIGPSGFSHLESGGD